MPGRSEHALREVREERIGVEVNLIPQAQKEQIINFINNSYPRKKACARSPPSPPQCRPSSSPTSPSATPSPPRNLPENTCRSPRTRRSRSCAKSLWKTATAPTRSGASSPMGCRSSRRTTRPTASTRPRCAAGSCRTASAPTATAATSSTLPPPPPATASSTPPSSPSAASQPKSRDCCGCCSRATDIIFY
jgi:hypothetical protein